MNKEQADILIDIIVFALLLGICLLGIYNLPVIDSYIGYSLVFSLCVLGITVSAVLIYIHVKDLNYARD